MDEIISYLRQSLNDEVLAKEEKRTLAELMSVSVFNQEQFNFVSTKIYELANEKATADNYSFILAWLKNVHATLAACTLDKSEVFFSPGESCRQAIVKYINSANKHLRICVFTISDNRIAEAIITAHKKGMDIKILTDNDKCFDLGSDISQLDKAGIQIKIDNTPYHMHHKFMVVDEQCVLTGSYNWTQSAARVNQENILLTNNVRIVKSFISEFDKLWQGMNVYLKSPL